MKNYIISLAILLYGTVNVTGQEAYYYYKGQKINLTIDKEYINVIIEGNMTSDSLQDLNFEPDKKSLGIGIAKVKLKKASTIIEYEENVKALKTHTKIKYVFPYFERKGAEPISISDIFYVKLKNISDTTLLGDYAKKKNVRILKQVPYMPRWYILQLSLKNDNTLDIANSFYETGVFEEIDPAFMFNFKKECTNDPLFSQIWGLSNSSNQTLDINACEAWTLSLGTGVNVAVVDQGIDFVHNDLSANIHAQSFDAQSGTPPSRFIAGNTHGTHVAGTIAAARNNNIQVVGVAPGARIMGVSHDLNTSFTISAELASGISWAWQNGSDAISNSWGDQGGQLHNQLHSAILENAITDALTLGRNNRGCVVVFASGNWGVIDYPANFHADILTVGAINNLGQRSIFSPHQSSGFGTELDVVAPGNDILSTLPGNTTGNMSGTSMATPHVAGIAALILSVRPDLTQTQVRHAIESTCTKINSSGYTYSNNSAHPNGPWNNQVGHGLVNAYAAVYSVAPRISGPSGVCPGSSGTFTAHNFPSEVTWTSSSNLNLSVNGNTVSVTNNGELNSPDNLVFFGNRRPFLLLYPPTGWVKAAISGTSISVEKHFDINTIPFWSFDLPSTGNAGNILILEVTASIFDDIPAQVYWSVSPNQGVSWYSYGNPTYIGICQNNTYTVTASTENQCGTYSASKNITVTGGYPYPCHAPILYSPSPSPLLDSTGGEQSDMESKSKFGQTDIPGTSVYPNPVSNVFTVEIDRQSSLPAATDGKQLKQDPAFDIRLYDNQGALLRHKKTKGGTVQFNVANLPNGIYYLHIYDGVNEKPEIRQIMVEH